MPYRPTERTEAKRAATRERVVDAARALIAHGGYREAQVAAVAARAGVATGTVYRHFPVEGGPVRRGLPLASPSARSTLPAPPRTPRPPARRRRRLAAAIETFAHRALRARRQAWALLAEPVDPAVEAERLVFRRAHAAHFAAILTDGIASGELPDQDADLVGAALVGALGEALVGPLSPVAPQSDPTTPTPSSPSSSPSACAPSPTTRTPMSTLARSAPAATHEVRNQPPPLTGRDLFADNAPLVEALDREAGTTEWRDRLHAAGRFWGGAPMAWGALANEQSARPAHPRPLRPPPRRGRVPPRLARADGRRRARRAPRAPVDGDRAARRARRPRRALPVRRPGRGRLRLPADDDVRRRPGARSAARDRRRVGPAPDARRPTTRS